MKLCPKAKTARAGACVAPDCDHFTAKRVRVCRCCIDRLGEQVATRIDLLRAHGSDEALARAESEALTTLIALGPNSGPPADQHRRFHRSRP